MEKLQKSLSKRGAEFMKRGGKWPTNEQAPLPTLLPFQVVFFMLKVGELKNPHSGRVKVKMPVSQWRYQISS